LKARFGITPLSEAIDGRQSENAMAIIAAGADVHGQVLKRAYFDKAIEMLLFEPAYKMLEMGVRPDRDWAQFHDAIGALNSCCTGKGLEDFTVQKARSNVYFHKIIAWYRERDLDIENATYVFSNGNQPGGWRIPSFAEREKKTEEKQ
jgi:hypothetical protein